MIKKISIGLFILFAIWNWELIAAILILVILFGIYALFYAIF